MRIPSVSKTPLVLVALAVISLVVSPGFAQGLGVVSVASSGPCGDALPVVSSLGDPFGSFDGRVEGGNVLSGIANLWGWALDDEGVVAVDVLVDGVVAGRAELMQSRPDVSAAFPGFPGSALPGWTYLLDTSRYLNGTYTVSAQVIDNDGQAVVLPGRVYDFGNTVHNLKPFGLIDFPDAAATLAGTCDLGDPDRIYSVVDGWVLDAGIENNDHGVGYVELLIDGTIFANSRRDCVHNPVTGGFTNCYGVFRPDVQEDYETLKDSPNAGFRFVLDVGALVGLGYSEGSHVLTIRSGDQDSQVSNVDSINVNFVCNDDSFNTPSIGAVDVPDVILTTGVTQLTGWALDVHGIDEIRVLIDGEEMGSAAFGFPRPDVTSRFPGYPQSAAPGWIFDVSVLGLSDGIHTATVVAIDGLGERTTIGQEDFFVLVR